MKTRNILIYLFLMLPLLLMQSCLKNQEDIFDEASTVRLNAYLNDAKKTMTDAEHGWLFEIFPHSTQKYGGYVYTVDFDSLTATVGTELSPDKFVTSYYKMTNEVGPAFTFDTYNELMHFLSDPSSSMYQAYGGDFIFIIDSVSTDVIKVHGYRSLNTMYLRKLTVPASTYIASVIDFKKAFSDAYYTEITGTFNGKDLTGTVTTTNPSITFTIGDDVVTTAFVYTDKGFRLYTPIMIDGVSFNELEFDVDSHTYKGTDSKGNEFTLQGEQPAWLRAFYAWAGDYTLTIATGVTTAPTKQLDVQLVANSDKSTYSMKGLSSMYDIRLTYDKDNDRMILGAQDLVDLPNGNYVKLAMWDTEKGYVSYNTSVGFATLWDEANQQYVWEDNKVWGTYVVRGMILYEFNGSDRVGALNTTTYKDYLINGNNRVRGLVSLKKK